MVVVERRLTPDDVDRMIRSGELDEEFEFELVDGEVLGLGVPSLYHNMVVLAIIELLLPFARQIGGRVFGEGASFRTGPGGRNLRAPDVALVSKERLSIVTSDRRWGTEAPDLAVEVLSPEQYGESYARQKVPEYIEAGARLVWLVNPQSRTVRVFSTGSDEVSTYSDDAEIRLDAVAPGFRAPVSAFFPAA